MAYDGWGDYLADGMKTQSNHPIDRFVRRFVKNMLTEFALPWLGDCLTKYSEAEFHQKMAEGFDFISDWQLNHKYKYSMFIKGARRMRNKFEFDVNDITSRVVQLLNQAGWQVYDFEYNNLWVTINNVKASIYE